MAAFKVFFLSAVGDITGLLRSLEEGDREAIDHLIPLVYTELRTMARRLFRQERSGHTWQPTALVNEALIRLIGKNRISAKNRAHFFALASRAMRRLLISHARAARAAKRGGNEEPLPLDETLVYSFQKSRQVEALDDALQHLEQFGQRQAQVVEMRFFGGMSNKEIALALGVSISTVKNDWEFAKAWLKREVEP